jgi:NAD(P)-dependent dehydrogenase (short-subunit alcohol dehydrogenase family)
MNEARKSVIITGASQGIGAGLVDAFVKRGYGVVANSRSIQPGESENVVAIAGDAADARTAERVVAAALDRFGRIDTLINNAGIFIPKAFVDYTPDDFARVLSVNLAGFFTYRKKRRPKC